MATTTKPKLNSDPNQRRVMSGRGLREAEGAKPRIEREGGDYGQGIIREQSETHRE